MITSNIEQKITQYLFSENNNNNQHQSVESCYPKIFGHMVKFMLHFLDAEIQTTYNVWAEQSQFETYNLSKKNMS